MRKPPFRENVYRVSTERIITQYGKMFKGTAGRKMAEKAVNCHFFIKAEEKAGKNS